MFPILGRYGPFFLYSFTVVMGLGLLAAIGVTAWQARAYGSMGWFDGFLVSLSTGLIGSRIGFAAAHWSYFQERPSEAWQVWRGGLAYHGALLAGLAGLLAWSAWRGRSFEKITSLLAPGFVLANAFGWLACWLEGCAFGREAAVGLLSADLPDTFGIFAVRYQTQLIGMGLCLFTFFIILWLRRKQSPYDLFWLALFGVSASRALIALLRGETVPQFASIRADVLGDSAIASAALILLQYRRKARVAESAGAAPDSFPPRAGQMTTQEDHNET